MHRPFRSVRRVSALNLYSRANVIRVYAWPQKCESKSESLGAAFLMAKLIQSFSLVLRVVKAAWHQNDVPDERPETGGELLASFSQSREAELDTARIAPQVVHSGSLYKYAHCLLNHLKETQTA